MTRTTVRRTSIVFTAISMVLVLGIGCTPLEEPGGTRPATKFGATVWPNPGETNAQAIAREERTYGPMRIYRHFSTGLPNGWPYAASTGADIAASFKALPRDVLAGRHDAALRTWFATAPTDRKVYWTYYHEPEDNIARGEFTAADYRAAWVHLTSLARRTNPRLHATLILMAWTVEAASGRDWRNYYAADAIDVFAWDAYNLSFNRGRYDTPAQVFGPALWVSRSTGKPIAFGEFGSILATGDSSGAGRAAWLTASAAYIRDMGALWAALFDAPVGGEFRLYDQPSADAWRTIMAG